MAGQDVSIFRQAAANFRQIMGAHDYNFALKFSQHLGFQPQNLHFRTKRFQEEQKFSTIFRQSKIYRGWGQLPYSPPATTPLFHAGSNVTLC